jgi:hypothetical protein
VAEWHATIPLDYPPRRNIWEILGEWVGALPESTEEEKKNKSELSVLTGATKGIFSKTYVKGMPEVSQNAMK